MATPAELLDNMVPVSAFSRGKAAQAFSSASNSTPVIVLKNNAPYRVITTPDEPISRRSRPTWCLWPKRWRG